MPEAVFVTRAKSNLKARPSPIHTPVDRSDPRPHPATRRVRLNGFYSARISTDPLRRDHASTIHNSGKRLVFLTNNFVLDAADHRHPLQSRWQVELFFKWIKQHLRIKAFFGTSENAVKSQIWIAVSVYGLRPGRHREKDYEILQILSLTLFEKTPVDSLFDDDASQKIPAADANQFNLFN